MDQTKSPHIKHEDEDFFSNPNFISIPQHQFQGQQFMHQNIDMNSVNPSDLTMGSMGNNMGNAMSSFGNTNNLSSSFQVGRSQIADDELNELAFYSNQDDQNQMQQNQGMFQQAQQQPGGMPVNQQHRIQTQQQIFSHTPEGAPIMSPFQNQGFDYSQFRTGSVAQPGSFHKMPQMSRQGSDRSPMTPKINGLHLGTPDSSQYMTQQQQQQLHHQRNTSHQWNGTPGSGSWVDSPLASPHSVGVHHPNMSEVIASGKHAASLPAKVEGAPQPNFQTQEAKRRRRRESHNLVERRRRDNINERIQDLSKLVPQHRLEDEKIRKHISTNGPLSPGLAAQGISPPQATSLLAGGSGRRAAGGITQGLPLDEKEKGPNKGDILNSSVSWTRDLMWLLHEKLEQEKELKAQFASKNMPWPYQMSDDEHRMVSELTETIQRNGAGSFAYSRYAGSALRVPGHTNYNGDALQGDNDTPQDLSPGMANDTRGSSSNDFWVGHNPPSDENFILKEEEEDEFGMELS